MATELALRIAGEDMVLHGDRALAWPARARLLIADLHLGKADVFRRAGIALPSGGTLHDLRRLSVLIAASGARELWVLGDLLHGAAIDTRWRDVWNAWRARHAGLRVVVLAGNHDRALAKAGLDIELPGAEVEDGPFALRHEPDPHPTLHVLCGHLHPAVALPGLPGRWPALWLRERIGVLPAFSQFTGGCTPRLAPGERIAVCVHGEAIALPAVPFNADAGSRPTPG